MMDALTRAKLLSVNAADDVTQTARREALAGKKVLFITCFLVGALYKRDKPHFENVLSFGPEIYYVFNNTDDGKAIAETFQKDGLVSGGIIWADMSDDKNAADNIIEAAGATGLTFDAVFSPFEHAMTLVGEVSERLGLFGNSKMAYINARDKKKSREVCEKAGVPSPRFAYLKNRSDIPAAIEYIGLPVVLKPNAGAASDGVYRCNSPEDVYKYFDTVEEGLLNNPVIHWSPGFEMCILLEEYITGDEFDVDVMLWNGENVYCNAIDNHPCQEPFFMETGSVCPTVYTGKKRQQLLDYSFDCVKAMGFTSGLFHVEIKYSMKRTTVDSDGDILGQPLLIEVNPRMGGGRTHLWHQEVYGVNIFENFFLASCGIPINPPRILEPKFAMGDYEMSAETSGILLNTRFFDHVDRHPNIVASQIHWKAGEIITGMDQGIPEWLGYYIVKAETSEEVNTILYDLLKTIQPPIAPITMKAGPTVPGKQETLHREEIRLDTL